MPEAVIVSTARTPIGRAFKGSLTEMRPDDLAAIVVKAAIEKIPNLDPTTIEDLMIGCAQPAGEHGYNMGRVVSLLAGLVGRELFPPSLDIQNQGQQMMGDVPAHAAVPRLRQRRIEPRAQPGRVLKDRL